MIPAFSILMVHADPTVLARFSAHVENAAEVSTATTFEQAKAALHAAPPTLLITGVQLGEYNGLHLIIRSRIDRPASAAILLSDRPDPLLEEEAARYGAACVSHQDNWDKLLSLVTEALAKTDV